MVLFSYDLLSQMSLHALIHILVQNLIHHSTVPVEEDPEHVLHMGFQLLLLILVDQLGNAHPVIAHNIQVLVVLCSDLVIDLLDLADDHLLLLLELAVIHLPEP